MPGYPFRFALYERVRAPGSKLPAGVRLVLTVIGLACREVWTGNGHAADARAFLDGDGFDLYAETLGVRPEALRSVLKRAGECP